MDKRSRDNQKTPATKHAGSNSTATPSTGTKGAKKKRQCRRKEHEHEESATTIHQIRPSSNKIQGPITQPESTSSTSATASHVDNDTPKASSSAPSTSLSTVPTTVKSKGNKKKTSTCGGHKLSSEHEEWARRTIFTEPKEDKISDEEVAAFQKELADELKFNFGKRERNKKEKEMELKSFVSFASGGFDQAQCPILAVKGSTSHLARYVFEDLIQCHQENSDGSAIAVPFLVAIPVSKDDSDGSLRKIFLRQGRLPGFGGTIRSLRKEKYYFITGTMLPDATRADIKESKIPLRDLQARFNNESIGKFTIQFDGTNLVKEFSWRSLVESPMDAMFFGTPITSNRFYSRLFKDRHNLSYCFQIYKQFTLELWGDTLACSKLNDAFREKQNNILRRKYKHDER